jgi:uncharacterized protein YjbI with pentapeptide repeats
MSTLESHSQIAAGEPVHFNRQSPRDQRTIPAVWIEEAVRQRGGVKIANAIIINPLRLKYACLSKEFSLLRCELTDPADFSCATFQHNLILSGSVFHRGVDLRSASLMYAARLAACRFLSGSARFADFDVHGQFSAQAVKFGSGVKAKFERARFQSYAIFRGCVFQGDAGFDDAQFCSDADFAGASFEAAASFNEATVRGTAHFERARFAGQADFTSVLIESDAKFRDARFRKLIFLDLRIGGNAVFTRARFAREASFLCARVVGQAEFQGAVFEGCANFNASIVDRDAFFRPEDPTDEDPKPAPRVTFEDQADFTGASIGGDADFREAAFKGPASFMAARVGGRAIFREAQFPPRDPAGATATEDCIDFRDAKFEAAAEFQGVIFGKRAQFDGSVFCGSANFGRRDAPGSSGRGARLLEVSFDRARFQADARFGETVFQGPVSFRECSFRVLEFSPSGQAGGEAQFQNQVRLRGCTYDRIKVDWRSLLRQLPSSSDIAQYERQPYVQMDQVFRAVGRDDEADSVYLERCRVERQRKKGLARVWDVFWWGLANYGVRPYRLIYFAGSLLLAGTLVFHRPGAVEQKAPSVPAAPAPTEMSRCPKALTLGESVRLSLRCLLPVELPLLESCQVSAGGFSDLAAALKILGWIIVPVGLAALAGVLRRGSPTPKGE